MNIDLNDSLQSCLNILKVCNKGGDLVPPTDWLHAGPEEVVERIIRANDVGLAALEEKLQRLCLDDLTPSWSPEDAFFVRLRAILALEFGGVFNDRRGGVTLRMAWAPPPMDTPSGSSSPRRGKNSTAIPSAWPSPTCSPGTPPSCT